MNALYCGVTGTGKTAIIRKFITKLPSQYFSTIFVMLSARTHCNETQDIIDSKLQKRTKGVFGPELGKKCTIFVDDLNMPEPEVFGAQPPLEILRLVLDKQGWYDRTTCKYKHLQDLIMVAAMNPPTGGRNPVTPRLLRHFNLIYATEFSDEVLTSIFVSMMEIGLNFHPQQVKMASKGLAVASIELYKLICHELPPTPAKFHYTFNLRDITNVFRGILGCTAQKLKNVDILYRLWIHEFLRVFSDRLIDVGDKQTFDELLKGVLHKSLKARYTNLCPDGEPLFCGFIGDH
jgi:dynein heavy chain